MKLKLLGLAASSVIFSLALSTAALAQVQVEGAWARVSVQGQKSTGAFMKLTARDNTRLVSASTPVAGFAEVHEMKLDGDVMKMRAVQGGLELPAGKAVELKPGGYHVMLMDLKAPLSKDAVVPMTLVFRDAKGVESRQEVRVPVALTAPGGAMAGMDHGMHKP